MKKFELPAIVLMLLTFGFVYTSNAQQQTRGLYLTYNDFVHHKLSYQSSAGDKIYIHEFIGQNSVTVINNGKKITLPKSTIFGYHDAYNNDYRFYDSKAYQVIDTTGFYIYSYDRLAQQGKGPRPTRTYYFGRKNDSRILPLTSDNIALAFPKNNKFKYMVEVASKSDIKLDTYDAGAGEYKIKELYAESLK